MEKRISYFEYQNAVSIAKLIDPMVREKAKALEQYDKLVDQHNKLMAKVEQKAATLQALDDEIEKYQSGIVKYIGFPVTDLIQKVMVPTGKMTPEGKPAMTAEFKPTNKVRYDEATKEYIITTPDEPALPSDFSEGKENESYNN